MVKKRLFYGLLSLGLLVAAAPASGQNIGRLENDSVFNGVKLGERFSKYMVSCSLIDDFKNGSGLMEYNNAVYGSVPVVEYLTVTDYKVTTVTCYVLGADVRRFLTALEKEYGSAKYSLEENAYVWFGKRAALVFYPNHGNDGKNVCLFIARVP